MRTIIDKIGYIICIKLSQINGIIKSRMFKKLKSSALDALVTKKDFQLYTVEDK